LKGLETIKFGDGRKVKRTSDEIKKCFVSELLKQILTDPGSYSLPMHSI